ncbi:unnamed protein product [Brassica oleracea var. botrytis]
MYPSRVRYLSCWVARVSQFHSDVSLRYLIGKELLIRKILSLNGPLRYGQRESVTCNLIDSKQSDVVSSLNSHHLIIVTRSQSPSIPFCKQSNECLKRLKSQETWRTTSVG